MKQKSNLLLLTTVGFAYLLFNFNYSPEITLTKVFVLTIAGLSLVYGLNLNGPKPTPTQKNTNSQTNDLTLKNVNFNDVYSTARIASQEILKGNAKEGISIYKKLIETSTQAKAAFLSQIANAEYSVGNYKTAINYYIQAMKNGADEDAMDDCIWNTFKQIFKKSSDEDYIKNYFDWVPKGAYHAEAKALLIGHYN